jgi:hypothetical protein
MCFEALVGRETYSTPAPANKVFLIGSLTRCPESDSLLTKSCGLCLHIIINYCKSTTINVLVQ